MDSSDVNTLIMFLAEAFSNLSKNISDNGSGNNSKLLKEINDSLSKLNGMKPSNDNSNLKDDLKRALSDTYSRGENTLLSEMKAEKTLLARIADGEDKSQNHLKNSIDALKEIKSELMHIGSNIVRQLSTGDVKLGVFSSITNALGSNVDMYRSMVSAGQDFGGSIINMRKVMNSSGLTLSQFSKSISEGTQGLRMLGVASFSQFSSSVNQAALALGDLGMSGDRLNDFMGDYLDNLKSQGRLGSLSNQLMSDSFRNFSVNVAQLSHAIGITQNEAVGRMRQSSANPMTQVLNSGLSESQNNLITHLSSILGQNDQSRRLFESLQYSAAVPGAAPTRDVASQLASLGAQSQYQNAASILQEIRGNRNITDEQAREYSSRFLSALNSIGNTQNINPGIVSATQYGVGNLAPSAFGLSGAIRALNLSQVSANERTGPTSKTLSGSDDFSREALRTDHLRQNVINSYETVMTRLIDANQKFLTQIIRTNNNILDQIAKLTTKTGDLMASMSGTLSSPLAGMVGSLANHPLLTLGGMAAIGVGRHLMAGSILRRAVGSLIPSIGRRIPSIGGLIRGRFGSTNPTIGRRIPMHLVNPQGLRSAFSFPKPVPSSNSLLSFDRASIARGLTSGMGLAGIGLMGGMAGNALTDTHLGSLITMHQNNESRQAAYELDRQRWKSVGSIAGTVGGGLLGSELGPLGMFLGSTLGSSGLSYIGGKLYDLTHTRPTSRQPLNIPASNNINQPDTIDQNPTSPSNSPTQRVIDTQSDILDNLKNINKILNSDSVNSKTSSSAILNKLDDINRNIKNGSNRIT